MSAWNCKLHLMNLEVPGYATCVQEAFECYNSATASGGTICHVGLELQSLDGTAGFYVGG